MGIWPTREMVLALRIDSVSSKLSYCHHLVSRCAFMKGTDLPHRSRHRYTPLHFICLFTCTISYLPRTTFEGPGRGLISLFHCFSRSPKKNTSTTQDYVSFNISKGNNVGNQPVQNIATGTTGCRPASSTLLGLLQSTLGERRCYTA
jgi:hypothetical protein